MSKTPITSENFGKYDKWSITKDLLKRIEELEAKKKPWFTRWIKGKAKA